MTGSDEFDPSGDSDGSGLRTLDLVATLSNLSPSLTLKQFPEAGLLYI
jgi:hypothetical protein